MLEDERGVDGAYGAILITRRTGRQRISVVEFVANKAHVFQTGWGLLPIAKRQNDIESRCPQGANRIADQRSAVELHRRLVAADPAAVATGEYCSDNTVLGPAGIAQFLPAV